MKTTVWQKLILWVSLGLLIFLNGYTFVHAVTGWMTAALALLLFLCLFSVWHTLSSRSDLFLRHTSWLLWSCLILLQVLFILFLHNNIRYDAFWILDEAVEMLDTHQISSTISNGYFSQVPNNYGLLLITYWFLSSLRFLGFSTASAMIAVQFLNLVFLDLALLFVYLTVKKMKGIAPAVFFLFLCFISPYPYLWAPYYYTSTTSMTFACAAVYLWLWLKDCSSPRKQSVLAGISGILCITGFKVRATSLIAYIAIALFWSVSHQKGSLKKNARAIAVFCLAAFLSFGIWTGIIRHYAPFDTTDTALPITHFMMMGSRRDGGFNQDDLRYSISLPTAQAKREGTIAVMKERLTENGFAGNILLLLNKQLNGWVDGTDSSKAELALCTDYNQLHPYIVGSKTDYLSTYAQAFRILQLLLVCISCLFALKRGRADGIFLLALNLLGGMTFHLLWEAGPLYSIAFTFFSYTLFCDGIERLQASGIFAQKYGRYFLVGSSLITLGITIFTITTKNSYYLKEEIFADDFVVNQHISTEGESGPQMKPGQIWTQTFETNAAFNVLQLYYGNPGMDGNTSIYHITLSGEDGSVYCDELLYGNATGYDLVYEFQFEPVVPIGYSSYVISIEPVSQDENSYIHFSSQDTSRVDLYPYGTLSIDGNNTNRDLSFRMLDRHITTRATKKEYGILAILLILLELYVFLDALFRLNTSGLFHQKRRTIS